MNTLAEPRRSTDARWFRVLDRFGLPTVLLLAVLWKASVWVEADRLERATVLRAIVDQLTAQTGLLTIQTELMRQLATEERRHADAVTATWPAMRVPPARPETP